MHTSGGADETHRRSRKAREMTRTPTDDALQPPDEPLQSPIRSPDSDTHHTADLKHYEIARIGHLRPVVFTMNDPVDEDSGRTAIPYYHPTRLPDLPYDAAQPPAMTPEGQQCNQRCRKPERNTRLAHEASVCIAQPTTGDARLESRRGDRKDHQKGRKTRQREQGDCGGSGKQARPLASDPPQRPNQCPIREPDGP